MQPQLGMWKGKKEKSNLIPRLKLCTTQKLRGRVGKWYVHPGSQFASLTEFLSFIVHQLQGSGISNMNTTDVSPIPQVNVTVCTKLWDCFCAAKHNLPMHMMCWTVNSWSSNSWYAKPALQLYSRCLAYETCFVSQVAENAMSASQTTARMCHSSRHL